MLYLLDTDTISALLKPRPNLVLARRLATERQEDVFTSAITVGELAYGVARVARPQLEERMLTLLDSLPVISFDEAAAFRYGSTRALLEKTGKTIAEPDLRIASIALTFDMTIVTGNDRHFRAVPGLRQENWLG